MCDQCEAIRLRDEEEVAWGIMVKSYNVGDNVFCVYILWVVKAKVTCKCVQEVCESFVKVGNLCNLRNSS